MFLWLNKTTQQHRPKNSTQTIRILLATMIGIATSASLAIAPLEASAREWSVFGRGENIVIADCKNCDEDTGITVTCKGSGRPAEVTVEWAASENGTEGAVVPIEIGIDGQVFNRWAITINYGLIGYTPQFSLSSGDPIIEAMQAGHTAKVKFAGGSKEIFLKGTRRGFDAFKTGCGWLR